MIFAQARRNAIKLIGEKSSSFDLARGRMVFLSGAFALAYVLLAGRAVDLAVIQGHEAQPVEAAEAEQAPVVPFAAARGGIYDRNGVMLATTLKMASLYADPHLISDTDGTAKALAKIFPGLPEKDVLKKFQSEKRFIRIRRDVSPEQQDAVMLLGEPGLTFQREDRRVYPQGAMTAHVIGYADIDGKGLAGIERGFDKILREGKDIKLSIDIRLQHALRRETMKAMKDFHATGAAGLIMDVNNGEILAGASLPDFDPYAAGDAEKDRMFNRLTLGSYEFGSIFKIFSTAAYLEIFDAPLSRTFDASKPLTAGKFTINDYHAENRVLTIPEIFMHSSNIGTAMMGQAIGEMRLKKFYQDLGLTVSFAFDVPEMGRPSLPEPWREVNTLTASYGHGVTTTALHVAAAAATIANGGTRVTPTLRLLEKEPAKGDRVVSEKTSHRMRQLMRLVVADGTGSKADAPGYNVAGKTGTAEKNLNGRYDSKRLLSSFVGVFPANAPRYLVFIMVDEPKPNKESFGYATAGWVAAPAVARVVNSMAAVLGIPPEKSGAGNDISASLRQFVSAEAR